jgi:hypothetical protein
MVFMSGSLTGIIAMKSPGTTLAVEVAVTEIPPGEQITKMVAVFGGVTSPLGKVPTGSWRHITPRDRLRGAFCAAVLPCLHGVPVDIAVERAIS